MQYLIDGHNLIGKMPDISLSDPDDEVQLILRLRSWTAVSQKRKVIVYFDGGIPGGKNINLSSSQVKVIFASYNRTADSYLIAHLKRIKNPPEYLLVTSDQEIIKAATHQKINTMRSEEFAALMDEQWQDYLPSPTITNDEDRQLSDAEVNEWMNIFGPIDEKAIRSRPKITPPNRKPPEPEPEEEAAPETYVPASNNREEPEMSDKELREWMVLFQQAAAEKEKPTIETTETINADGKKVKRTVIRRIRKRKAENPHNLNNDDLSAWQDFTNQKK
jgi:predicted RNA-binding protein with PIN domain